ncbi:MAG: hypothetical protein NTW19_14445 [Planctomycetota bacterium]|nr:hypothetical protein [Planctomycetota bacterium]
MSDKSGKPVKHFSIVFAGILAVLVAFVALPAFEAEGAEEAATPGKWRRTATAANVEKAMAPVVAYPEKKAEAATFTTAEPFPAGVYEMRFDAIPSHVGDGIAWYGELAVREPESIGPVNFPANQFERAGKASARVVTIVNAKPGPIRVVFGATAAMDMGTAFERRLGAAAPTVDGGDPKAGKGKPGPTMVEAARPVDDLLKNMELTELSPEKQFYFLIDRVRLRRLSGVGYPSDFGVDKIRYRPGEELKGHVTLHDLEGQKGPAELRLYLESRLHTRTLAKTIPVPALTGKRVIDFSLTLPKEELGYALVASLCRPDGAEAVECAEYFGVVENFYRTAIHYPNRVGRNMLDSEMGDLKAQTDKIRASYSNCFEVFAWAQEDMVGMSPAQDVWFSGQTCYRISKAYMKELIRASHEGGVSAASYGKFIMSGYLGWKTAWDRPLDHRRQYHFPVGNWGGTNEHGIQQFRYGEFNSERGPATGGAFKLGRPDFIPVDPDPTPAMAKVAGEEIVRAMKMFGWDAIRWDGHPRGDQVRKTQALVRYLKEVVAKDCPDARWGYNYLNVEGTPSYDWAVQDNELDELCAGGWLLMNESIRKSIGQPFEWIARNIQVEGDLARERGGYLLGISCDHVSARDAFIEAVLYFAGGCRPMGGAAGFPEINRYGTRYSCYTFDERLRRLEKPEAVIQPAGKTNLWWQPFVYETPRGADGASQLVVNLMNIPKEEKPLVSKETAMNMGLRAGSEPAAFRLTLPAGCAAGAARLIDPFTLAVRELESRDESIAVPAVPVWSVLVVDLRTEAGAKGIAEQFGPPATVNKTRPNSPALKPIVLDVAAPTDRLWQQMVEATGGEGWTGKENLEEPAFAALPLDQRNAKLIAHREAPSLQPAELLKSQFDSITLSADFAERDRPHSAEPIVPVRTGRLNVFHGCGVLANRLRLDEALAGVGRFSYWAGDVGGWRGKYGMTGQVGPNDFACTGLVVYSDVPTGALGAAQNYAMLRWIKGGGAALFTGGPYAFGHGGSMHTILDRELLPVVAPTMMDIRYNASGLPLEPGPDFDLLGLPASFREELARAKPLFWAFNEDALRPGADVKVFLKSGNRPVLVGWQLGQGRVGCMLAATMGASEKDRPAFFEWDRWPELLGATIKWLAPHGTDVGPAAAVPAQVKAPERDAALQLLEDQRVDRLIGAELDGAGAAPGSMTDAVAAPKPPSKAKSTNPDEAKLVAAMRTLLAAGPGDTRSSAALADQLGALASIPFELNEAVVRSLAAVRPPPERLVDASKRCAQSTDAKVQALAPQLLALAGKGEFVRPLLQMAGDINSDIPQVRFGRMVGIGLYQPDDLVSVGAESCKAWETLSAERLKAYTDGKGFNEGSPPMPLIDADSLLERASWLSYLYRRKPEEYAGLLLREWLLLRQYGDYCDQTYGSLQKTIEKEPRASIAAARIRIDMIVELQRSFQQVRFLADEQARDIVRNHPAAAAEVISRCFFRTEVEQALNLLGGLTAKESRVILERLVAVHHPHLGEFAARRLKE